jgi:4'-phosphopantetheinyl transferase EntD
MIYIFPLLPLASLEQESNFQSHWLSLYPSVHPKVRLQKLNVKYQLYQLFGEHAQVQYQPSGKPYLAHGLHISISHSRTQVAIQCKATPTVGLDIQHFDPLVFKIQQRFLHPSDYVLLEQYDPLFILTLIWSTKEAVFKYYSNPDLIFRKHIQILHLDSLAQTLVVQVNTQQHCLAYTTIQRELLVWLVR